ncbi:hypothetical protein Tco_0824098 [Tanacetum coccineum]|uniref:Uncharacterized protein n=1 Tax=Tanacetum coccineum TaxID=301880 RepID=A0ABQ5ALL1_9ASTR
MKRRKSSKDAELSKDSRSKEKKTSSTSKDASKSQHKSFGKSAHAESQVILLKTQACNKIKSSSRETMMNNPLTRRKPLSLIQDHQGRQIIPKDYFINNDLEYMKGGDLSRRYSTSVTKTKAATYELKWIEDLVPELWSPVQRRIIAVTRLKIMKKYDYGHLEEIEVRRDDQKLYTFKEEEIDAKSREVHWWKGIRESSQATGKDNMTLDYMHFYQLSHSELDGIEKVVVCSSLRSLKPKCTIESRAKRDHP